MTAIWGIFAVLLAIVWVITIVDLIRSHVGAQRTIAWVLLIVLVPFLGALLYWVLRKPGEHDVEIAHELDDGAPRPPGGGPQHPA